MFLFVNVTSWNRRKNAATLCLTFLALLLFIYCNLRYNCSTTVKRAGFFGFGNFNLNLYQSLTKEPPEIFLKDEKTIRVLSFGYVKASFEVNLTEVCPLLFDCVVTHDGHKRLLPTKYYHGIMVHGPDALRRIEKYIEERKVKRIPEQIWMARSSESAISQFDFQRKSPLGTLFNWSVGLSSLATIEDTYVFVSKIPKSLPFFKIKEQFQNLKKDKSFCWMISNCIAFNDRLRMGIELINRLPDKTHLWGKASVECMTGLNRSQIVDHGPQIYTHPREHLPKCKFYFAFENSNCSDYITEKFPNALMNHAIPIVNGWRESYVQKLPGSFIHVSDFESVSHLASYLEYLLRNETAYFEYFRWRENYEVSTWYSSPRNSNNVYCEACKKLKKFQEDRKAGMDTNEMIHDLAQTFSNLQKCVKL